MALNFRLIKHKVLNGIDKDKIKNYAQAKYSGVTSLNQLCKLISTRSAISSAHVKSVIDNLNWVMDLELREGRVVQLGEFGSFRLSISSEGTEDPKDFNASKIKKARIIFTPGASLRATNAGTVFISDDVQIVKEEIVCDKEHIVQNGRI